MSNDVLETPFLVGCAQRWGLRHGSRMYVAYKATREEALALFAEDFRLDPALIENMVEALGPNTGRVLVDRAPARESQK